MDSFLVAGAGPAGLIVSIMLARAGKTVRLVDQTTDAPKVGECVPSSMARLLDKLDLPPLNQGDHHARVGGILSQWGGELRQEDYLFRAEGGGWRLDRRRFEADLEAVAIAAGVQRLNDRVRHAAYLESGWDIELSSGAHLEPAFMIDATGRPAWIAKAQGAGRLSGPALVALWAMGESRSGPASQRTLIESMDDGWWYGASLPGGHPMVIFHTSPGHAAELRKAPDLWGQRLRATQHVATQLEVHDLHPKSLRALDARSSRLQQVHGPGWAACGDAAMSFDPLSSQGIFNAMANGHQLAETLLQSDPESGLHAYGQKLDEIWSIYMQRRRLLYETAAAHHRTAFWKEQLS